MSSIFACSNTVEWASLYTHACALVQVFPKREVLRRGIAGSWGMHILRVDRNCQTGLLKCCTNLPYWSLKMLYQLTFLSMLQTPSPKLRKSVVFKFCQSSLMCNLGFPLSSWGWASFPMLVLFVICLLCIAHSLYSHFKAHIEDQPWVWDSNPSLREYTWGFCYCWVPRFNQREPAQEIQCHPPPTWTRVEIPSNHYPVDWLIWTHLGVLHFKG